MRTCADTGDESEDANKVESMVLLAEAASVSQEGGAGAELVVGRGQGDPIEPGGPAGDQKRQLSLFEFRSVSHKGPAKLPSMRSWVP